MKSKFFTLCSFKRRFSRTRTKNVDKCSNLSGLLDFSSLSSTNTYLHDTRCRREKGVEKKGRKEKKRKGRMFVLWQRSFKATLFAPHTHQHERKWSSARRTPTQSTTARFMYNCLPVGYNFRLGCLQKARNLSSRGDVESSCYLHAWLATKNALFPGIGRGK